MTMIFKRGPNEPKRAQRRIERFATEKQPNGAGKRLGDRLIEMGVVSPEKIVEALEVQRNKGGLMGETMLRMGAISREQLQIALGVRHGMLRDGVLPKDIPSRLVMAKNAGSAHAEEFRNIRTRLLTTIGIEKLNLFSIVSNEVTGAADYVAANLAMAFAQLGKQTLILDADLRSGRMRKFFKLEQSVGVNGVLSGDAALDDVILPTVISNLYVAQSGATTGVSQELLASDAFGEILEMAKASFDVVLVTTAPFGKTSDGHLVWSQTQGAFVAVRKDKDRIRPLKKLNDTLRQMDVEVLGAALTR